MTDGPLTRPPLTTSPGMKSVAAMALDWWGRISAGYKQKG